MFLAENLMFLELQKTGGSHIGRLLEAYVDGRTAGKHHRIMQDVSEKAIIGSIRNPWDWYVSLWAFGCGGKGSIRNRTGKNLDLEYYRRGLPDAMGKNHLNLTNWAKAVIFDLLKPVSLWQQTYINDTEHNPSGPEAFRQWLKLLLDPARRFDIGEGYGFSPVSQCTGLLTYRYLRLFTLGDAIYKDKSLCDKSALAAFDREHNITSGVIRMESLEEDFIRLLTEAGIELSEAQSEAIRNKKGGKTNTSKRKSAAHYYDEETRVLVAEKDSYLINKYNYTAPY